MTEVHAAKFFKDVPLNGKFRTGTQDLTIWRKIGDCCATPLTAGFSKKFLSQQTVYVIRRGS